MRKKTGIICATVLCSVLIACALPIQSVPPLIRLHVLAVSDSEEDQAEKLLVRDAVLAQTQQLLSDCTDFSTAYAALDERISDIEAAARTATNENIGVSLTKEYYPERQYGSVIVPEGEYISLRVIIGEGEGQNWWCVVYPSLCRPQDDSQIAKALENKPLRSIVWQWLCGLWKNDMEDTANV